MAAVLEGPGRQLVRNVPPREPVPGASDAGYRGNADFFSAQRKRYSHLEAPSIQFQTVGIDSPDDLTKSKLGEYGEMQHGWTAEDAKGFIKVSSTPLRVYYGMHPNEEDNMVKVGILGAAGYTGGELIRLLYQPS